MPLDAGEGREARPDAGSLEEPGDRALLVDREQQVRLHPDHQRLLERGAAEDFHRVAVRSEIEAVHGA